MALLPSSVILSEAIAISNFFIKTEIARASLLDELWETKITTISASVWNFSVKECQSVRKLWELTLLPIDATLHRAFGDGMNRRAD